jgi:hypothetical protein
MLHDNRPGRTVFKVEGPCGVSRLRGMKKSVSLTVMQKDVVAK